MEQNHPNPFSSTHGWIILYRSGKVSLSVYNIRGEIVCTLYAGEQAAGKHSIEWNAKAKVEISKIWIYFYRLQTENVVETKKMFLLKVVFIQFKIGGIIMFKNFLLSFLISAVNPC